VACTPSLDPELANRKRDLKFRLAVSNYEGALDRADDAARGVEDDSAASRVTWRHGGTRSLWWLLVLSEAIS
jgi:hypothetical protein